MEQSELRNIRISTESLSKANERGMWAQEQAEFVVVRLGLSKRFENIHPDDIRGVIGAVSQAKRFYPKDFLDEEKRQVVIHKTMEILGHQADRIRASGEKLPKLTPLDDTSLGRGYD